MKQSATSLRGLLPIGLFVFASIFSPLTVFAKPRPPQPPWPEQTLAAFGWDAPYERVPWRGIALGEDAALLRESWSGYALTRDALAVEPVVIPVRDAAGKPVVATAEGAIRFWFCPDWESADQGGKGPGGYARLLELVHWGGKGPETKWALYVSDDGGALYLSGQGLAGAQDVLKAGVSFEAGGWRLLTVSYSATNTVLYVDAEKVADGPPLVVPADWELGNLGLVVGSDAFAGNPAGGQFEELTLFDQWARNEPWQKLYFKGAGRTAWMGPVGSKEEEAAKYALWDELQMLNSEGGPPESGEGESGEDPGGDPPIAYSYVSGLWLEITGVSNGLAYVTIHGTVEHEEYELLSRETLTNTTWIPEAPMAMGAEGQDWTETTVVIGERTNSLFLFVRSYLDSDDDGLPDWWELENGLDPHNPDTGNTGVSDGYKDNDGDGWTNLQEYQNGTNPNAFDLPPPPTIVSVTADWTGTNVTITWMSGGGPVQSYSIEQFPWSPVLLGSVSSSADTFVTTLEQPILSTPFDAPIYQVRANFAGGISSVSAPAALDAPLLTLEMRIVRGPEGKLYLTVKSPPPNLERIQVLDISSFFPWFEVWATNLVNGLMELPEESIEPAFGYWMFTRSIGNDGRFGSVQNADPDLGEGDWLRGRHDLLVNAAAHIKENLTFLLRSATLTQPFGYKSRLHPLNDFDDWSPADTDPGGRMGRPIGFGSYECYGFRYYSPGSGYHVKQLDRPVRENFLWRNFAFAAGDPSTGRDYDPTDGLRAFWHSPWYRLTGFLNAPPPLPLLTNAENSAFFFRLAPNPSAVPSAYEEVGLGVDAENLVYLPAGVRNVYGLGVNAIRTGAKEVVAGSSPIWEWNEVGTWYVTTALPQLATVNYYFASQGPYFAYPNGVLQPMPGSPTFSVTNESPLLVATVGEPFPVAGWAKQAITNGYTGKYAYLEQYFDKAYTVDTNGVATTNQTGLLSPYGEFFPTEPGRAALVTMPDIETGQRGTGVVHVIKLQLDVNHDGVMDLTFGGPDNTFQGRPFVFWLNNDRDQTGSGGNLDFDAPVTPGSANTDYAQGQIRNLRNLEDFARLWICGMPTLPAAEGYSVQLEWGQIDFGAPRLRLYRASEINGGTGYLTNITTASEQILDDNYPVGEVTPTNTLSLPISWFTNGLNRYFLFEAGGIGKGALTLTISQGTNVIAQTSAWMDFHDIRDFYEEVAITSVIQTWPEMVQTNLNSDFRVQSFATVDSGDAPQMTVFVHGWRMPYSEYQIFSQTMFKRLYWQGYQGKFAALRWPTRSSDTDPDGLDFLTFNRSEYIAFQSGTGAALYFYDLRQRFTNYTISVCSHSQGGILMMEALKELAASSESPLDNYVMMQTAVPAHCYDTTMTNLPSFLDAEASVPTPNTYSNYAFGITSALRPGGKIINFYNTNDFALASGRTNLLGVEFNISWEGNESSLLLKPLLFFGYYYIASNNLAVVTTNQFTAARGVTNLQTRFITDPLELMPFVARPRSKAVGAQAGVAQIVNGGQLDLAQQLGFTDAASDHSGQFNRNIQTSQVQQFYFHLRSSLFPP